MPLYPGLVEGIIFMVFSDQKITGSITDYLLIKDISVPGRCSK